MTVYHFVITIQVPDRGLQRIQTCDGLIKAEPGTTRQELYTMAVDTALAQIGAKRAPVDRMVLFFSLEPNELPG
ncbi:hypothetical protein [Actinocorallia populi]|uniref:hypothetical protein n=1 Tax=Actinocorallia populi TaxID=2079200 RepID=UPI000D0969A1|nr:hypothetical protein [Actinocorallia populi]